MPKFGLPINEEIPAVDTTTASSTPAKKKDVVAPQKTKEKRFDEIITIGIHEKLKDKKDKLSKEKLVELKSYSIKKALKLKKYVRN